MLRVPLAPALPAGALPPSPAQCVAYSAALLSAIGRDEAALAELRRLEGQARPGGRGQGLEWAIDEAGQTITLLRELETMMRALAPFVPELRRAAGLAT